MPNLLVFNIDVIQKTADGKTDGKTKKLTITIFAKDKEQALGVIQYFSAVKYWEIIGELLENGLSEELPFSGVEILEKLEEEKEQNLKIVKKRR